MALRTLGVVTGTGAAQPVIGDVLTAAMLAPTAGVDTLITVASTALYMVGDRIYVEPGTLNRTCYKITQIVSATTMRGSLEGAPGKAHVTGSIVQLAIACCDLVVQPVPGGSANATIGADNTLTATPGGSAIFTIEKVAVNTLPNEWRMNTAGVNGQNPFNTSEAWMILGSGDKALTYALVN